MNSDLSSEAVAPHAAFIVGLPAVMITSLTNGVLSARAHDDARKRTVNPRSLVEHEWLVSELDVCSL